MQSIRETINFEDKRFKTFMLCLFLGVLIFFSYGIYMRNVTNINPDTFFHITLGRDIVKTHSVPIYDKYSWFGIQHKLKTVNHEWLFGVVISQIYGFFGFRGIALFSLLIYMITLYFLYKIISKKVNNFNIRMIIMMMIVACTQGFITGRPQVVSFLLLSIYIYLLENKKYWWTILVAVLAVNFHGGFFPIYFVVLFYYLGFKKIYIYILNFITIITVPHFIYVLLYPLSMINSSSQYISEWQPTAIMQYKTQLIVYIIIIMSLIYSSKKVKIKDFIYFLLFGYLIFSSVRHLVFIGVFIIPITSEYIGLLFKQLFSWKFEFRKFEINKFKLDWSFWSIVLLSFSIGMNSIYFINFGGKKYVNQNAPIKACNFIQKHKFKNLYNVYELGDYMMFRGIKPMVDGRADLYDTIKIKSKETFLTESMQFGNLQIDYTDFIKKYKIKYLLLYKNRALAMVLRKEKNKFKSIYSDNNFIILKTM